MRKALQELDAKLSVRGILGVKLLIGGGAAFSLAYQVALQTADIDGVIFKSAVSAAQFDAAVKETACELGISPDWLNPYFETFLGCLPADYGERLTPVFSGKSLGVFALGMTDLLVMKCFAGREKDMPHAKVLIKKGADIHRVDAHLRALEAKKMKGAREALDFLIEAEDQLGE